MHLNTIYLLKVSDDNPKLVEEKIDIPPYHKNAIIKSLQSSQSILTAGDFRKNGLAEIVDEIYYPINISLKNRLEALSDDMIVNESEISRRTNYLSINKVLSEINLLDYLDLSLYEKSFTSFKGSKIEFLNLYHDLLNKIMSKCNEYDCGPLEIEKKNNFQILETNIFIAERFFIRVCVNLGPSILIRRKRSVYNTPKWDISINNDKNNLSLSNNDNIETYKCNELSIKEIIDKILKFPMDYKNKVESIMSSFNDIFCIKISQNDIFYDWARNCYCLKKEKEELIFSEFIAKDAEDEKYAKYTSLDTLIATFNSGNFRLNSIVTMNDKTEVNFLSDKVANFKESIEEEGDEFRFANEKFITSFTSRIDELDMWRFYGDNARGVCIIFEKEEGTEVKIKDIKYIKHENALLEKIDNLFGILKKEEIDFRIITIENNRIYFKPNDFETEKESRLFIKKEKPDGWYINNDNKIITPYIEKKIPRNSISDNDFPLKIEKIILGPNSEQSEINIYQIKHLLHSKGLVNIEVVKSKIKSFR